MKVEIVAGICQNVPSGKFRVVALHPTEFSYRFVRDCDTQDKAFELADELNRKRTDRMDDVHYVYNDAGKFLRGEEAIKNSEGKTAVGVSP